ncbi:hypothetical protein [Rhodopirellula europaea]|uniref:hypothetical protein n=1 Tax=Rhodopirellula europaea TaxID=1263866 RepID=UPI003D294BDA
MNSSAESGDDESEARRYRESLLEKMKRSSEAFVSMNPVSDQEPDFDEETQRLVDEILGKSPDDEKDPLDDEKMDEIVDEILGKDRKVATPIENVNPDRGMPSRSAGRGFFAWGSPEEPKPKVIGSGFGNYGSRKSSNERQGDCTGNHGLKTTFSM